MTPGGVLEQGVVGGGATILNGVFKESIIATRQSWVKTWREGAMHSWGDNLPTKKQQVLRPSGKTLPGMSKNTKIPIQLEVGQWNRRAVDG